MEVDIYVARHLKIKNMTDARQATSMKLVLMSQKMGKYNSYSLPHQRLSAGL